MPEDSAATPERLVVVEPTVTDVMERVSPSASESAPFPLSAVMRLVTVEACPSVTSTESFLATGASLALVTLRVTVAVSVVVPSESV